MHEWSISDYFAHLLLAIVMDLTILCVRCLSYKLDCHPYWLFCTLSQFGAVEQFTLHYISDQHARTGYSCSITSGQQAA